MNNTQQHSPMKRIEVSSIRIPKPKNTAQAIRDVILRFEEQEFTVKHLQHVLRQRKAYAAYDGLNEMVRGCVYKLVRQGRLDVVSKGRGCIPGVYKRAEKSAKGASSTHHRGLTDEEGHDSVSIDPFKTLPTFMNNTKEPKT